jgi:hypothetical protein
MLSAGNGPVPPRSRRANAYSERWVLKLLLDLGERASWFRFLVRDRAGQFTDAFCEVYPFRTTFNGSVTNEGF